MGTMDALNVLGYVGLATVIVAQRIKTNYLRRKVSRLQKSESFYFNENARLRSLTNVLNFKLTEQKDMIKDLEFQKENQFINIDYLKNTLKKYQRINTELCDKIDLLIDKRRFNRKQKKAGNSNVNKPVYEFKPQTNK
jgi:hypothetical protein